MIYLLKLLSAICQMFLSKPVKKPEGNLEENAVLSLSSISLGISE